MNTHWNEDCWISCMGFIMSYAQREYNFVQTPIKNMINLVDLISQEETTGDLTWKMKQERSHRVALAT
jgi:hypothetical protein